MARRPARDNQDGMEDAIGQSAGRQNAADGARARGGEEDIAPAVTWPEDRAGRALLLYLRGWPYVRIGAALGVHRNTAARLVKRAYDAAEPQRRARLAARVREAVARVRLVQTQAWADHDADEERERLVLKMAREGGADRVRYQSQRAQYLRVVLDAEKEIARLEGLYDAGGAEMAGTELYVLRIERLVPGQAPRVRELRFVDAREEGDEGTEANTDEDSGGE